jgi:hypothetical protein
MTSHHWVISFRNFDTNVVASFSRIEMSKILTVEEEKNGTLGYSVA